MYVGKRLKNNTRCSAASECESPWSTIYFLAPPPDLFVARAAASFASLSWAAFAAFAAARASRFSFSFRSLRSSGDTLRHTTVPSKTEAIGSVSSTVYRPRKRDTDIERQRRHGSDWLGRRREENLKRATNKKTHVPEANTARSWWCSNTGVLCV